MLRIVIDIETQGVSDEEVVAHVKKNEFRILQRFARSFGNVHAEEAIEGSEKIEASMVEIHRHQHGYRGQANCNPCTALLQWHPTDLTGADENLVLIENQ